MKQQFYYALRRSTALNKIEYDVHFSYPRSHIVKDEKAICGSPLDAPFGLSLTKMTIDKVNCKRCLKIIEKESLEALDDNELKLLRRKVSKLVAKCDRIGYKYSDIDLGAIRSISKAESYSEVNWLALQHFEHLYAKVFKLMK